VFPTTTANKESPNPKLLASNQKKAQSLVRENETII